MGTHPFDIANLAAMILGSIILLAIIGGMVVHFAVRPMVLALASAWAGAQSEAEHAALRMVERRVARLERLRGGCPQQEEAATAPPTARRGATAPSGR
jgi:hypothetical protein